VNFTAKKERILGRFTKDKKCWYRKELLIVSIKELMVTDVENES
jgi:hypothetical protein